MFTRDYVKREKKSLIPTEKGLTVYQTVKNKRIADVALIGEWENALTQIENGKMQPETFRKAIETYTRQITAELLDTQIAIAEENAVPCPKCKAANVPNVPAVRLFPKVAKCTAENCGFIIFRTVSKKQLSDKQITDLLTNGKTALIKGFKSKGGKTFDAVLKFDENYRVIFDFPKKKPKK